MQLRERRPSSDGAAVASNGPGDFAGAGTGLSKDEAAARFRAYGPNLLDPPTAGGVASAVFLFFVSGCAVVFDRILLAAVMGFIGLAQGAVEVYARRSARQSLAGACVPAAMVLRDGKWGRVPAAELVFGDIVKVGADDVVPADLAILQSEGLRVDESVLTRVKSVFEDVTPMVIGKSAEAEEFTVKGFPSNVLYATSRVFDGTGLGQVIATGPNTQIGTMTHRPRRQRFSDKSR